MQQAAQQLAKAHKIGFMLLKQGQKLEKFLGEAKDEAIHFQEQGRIAVLYNTQDKPSSAVLLENRSYAIERKATHWRHLQLPNAQKSADEWQRWLEDKDQLQAWLMPPDVTDEIAEANLQQVGSKVSIDEEDNTTHFMVGNSSELMKLLDQLDIIKRRFRGQIGSDVGTRREHFKKALDKLLANEGANDKALLEVKQALEYKSHMGPVKKAFSDIRDTAQLPKVLIIGPSGAGKSFVSRYLSRRTSADAGASYRPMSRISIPEYLGDEKRLEFDLFGYCKGAYTDAKAQGDAGILFNHIGGVIFLDEIGEASPSLQAKLLAFMDDYKVKPRGWFGEGIFCPVLLVAATNKPVNTWADEDECGRADSIRFRHDLYQRFDSVIHLPGLNERREDLPLLVDALLQLDAVNPGGRIKSISKDAVDCLKSRDYAKGNFRELRRLLVDGCQRASARQNPVILKRDVDI